MAHEQIADILRYIRHFIGKRPFREQTDSQLLECFVRDRDEAAFAAVVQRHGPLVLSVSRQVLHDMHGVEDVFQAAFLVLARKAPSIRRTQALASWLYRVAYRLAVHTRAQANRQAIRKRRLMELRPPDLQTELEDPELWLLLHKELERLPEKYQAPLVLCYLQGKTNEQAAGELGWTISTLRGRLFRGRGLLRVRLAQQGVALSAGTLAALPGGANASVPAGLASTTVEAAFLFTTGRVASADAISAQTIALAEGMLQIMGKTKLKLVAALFISMAFLAVGTGLVIQAALFAEIPAQAEQQESADPADRQRAKPDHANLAPTAAQQAYGLLARTGKVRLRHESAVWFVALSPDSRALASVARDRITRLWNLETGELQHKFGAPEANSGRPCPIAFSPDGRILAGGGEMEEVICFWDAATGKKLQALDWHEDWVSSLAFSPDGSVLASGSCDGMICLWEVATGNRLKALEGHKDAVCSVAFSSDGKTLASGGRDYTVRLWSVTKGKELRQWRKERPVHSSSECWATVAFHPDGRRVATRWGDGEISLWDATTGNKLQQITAPDKDAQLHEYQNDYVTCSLDFAPDGRTLVSSNSTDIVLY